MSAACTIFRNYGVIHYSWHRDRVQRLRVRVATMRNILESGIRQRLCARQSLQRQ
jgi:hypothetical protein